MPLRNSGPDRWKSDKKNSNNYSCIEVKYQLWKLKASKISRWIQQKAWQKCSPCQKWLKILNMPTLVKFFHLYMSKVNGPSASSRVKSGHTMANFTGFSAQGVQGSSKRYCKRNLRFCWSWYGKWKTLEQKFVSLKPSWGFSNWSIVKKQVNPINLHLPKIDVSSPTHASPTWTDNFLTPNRHKVIWSATPLSGKSMCPPS